MAQKILTTKTLNYYHDYNFKNKFVHLDIL